MQANDVQVTKASQAFIDEVKSKTSTLEQKWVAEAKAKGVPDPAQVLKEFRALDRGRLMVRLTNPGSRSRGATNS